ncbi:PstS family phosphate ABC transporter substrate-binding protein [Bacterioplanoides sp.]|uniref:PstS family phosphate ABC transporter substrate-binding protein n=1 Tax=Bacterioplanoides sp. TaxID=2066072 RepID=UPI003AFF8844
MKKVLLTGAAVMAAALSTTAQAERDYISIVGSSTVYPFSTVVAERFGKSTDFRTPKVESTGSGGGLKLFCSGVGDTTPDITNASRAIKGSEIKLCAKNGVTEIVEVKVGYDGIVLANTKAADRMELSRKDIFLALAKNVPNPDGSETLVDNPYKTWKDVNPALPNRKIEVLGPPPTSGTRDAFVELAMEGGCKKVPFIKAIKKQDKKKFKAICHGMREDGAYVEAGENDNLIVQKLVANPNALGIFGFSFLEQNSDKVQGSKVDGKLPTFDAISEGDYPVSRSLFFYVKKAHVGVIPGIEEYLAEFTSERAMGEDGYLADKGMIPMLDDERAEVVANVKNLKPIAAK